MHHTLVVSILKSTTVYIIQAASEVRHERQQCSALGRNGSLSTWTSGTSVISPCYRHVPIEFNHCSVKWRAYDSQGKKERHKFIDITIFVKPFIQWINSNHSFHIDVRPVFLTPSPESLCHNVNIISFFIRSVIQENNVF